MRRRQFLQSIALAAATPALPLAACAGEMSPGPLRSDPDQVIDLPPGYTYRVVSRAGNRMNDGLVVPHNHDGMAAFPGPDGRIILVCNHEIERSDFARSAFAPSFEQVPKSVRDRIYDLGDGSTPSPGGTTTTIYNPATGKTERQYLSLAGTEVNCAGGSTPWGSWLSCEECFESPGLGLSGLHMVRRAQKHGYVFEVPALGDGLAEPLPIREMGRFVHEACAIHEASGIVYMTEDQHHSLFYRYIPNVKGRLHEGGRLQALMIDCPGLSGTHNWSRKPDVTPGTAMCTRWIDLEDVDSNYDDLRDRGAESGATTFARGEGLCAAGDDIVFTCTIGGRARLGQVFAYRPSPHEGSAAEVDKPGTLTLLAESSEQSLLRNSDNLTMAPWGDLIICEDTSDHCGLIGMRADGTQYTVADNPHSNSELAGVCFSPDGRTLFVNIQYPGLTVAITGPWPT